MVIYVTSPIGRTSLTSGWETNSNKKTDYSRIIEPGWGRWSCLDPNPEIRGNTEDTSQVYLAKC